MSDPSGRSRRSAARSVRSVVGAVAAAGIAAIGWGLQPAAAAGSTQPAWSPAVSLVRCSSVGFPRVVFPASDPFHAAGQGGIVWSGDPADCNPADAADGAGVGIADFEPDHTLGSPQDLPVAGAPQLTGLSAATATGDGRIVLAGGVGAAADGTVGMSQGLAAGVFSPAGEVGGRGPIAATSSYRGDVAVASVSRRGKVELRLEPHGMPAFTGPIVMTSRDATVTALAVNLDYRGDAVVAWAEKGAIYVRVRASTGVLLTTQRVASSPPEPRLAALISDDNRAIVAWENDRTAVGDASTTTSTYLDISVPGIHFAGPHLLDRFVDPPGVVAPASGLQMVRLAYEGVVVAWTGLLNDHFVVKAAPVSVNSIRPATTVSNPNADAMLSDLATGPKDEVIALWTTAPRAAGQRPEPAQRILSARGLSLPSGVTRFDTPQLVAGPGLVSSPRLAIDPVTDVAVAVWRNRSRNPGIDYAVRGPSDSDTSIVGQPGTTQTARRAGTGGPSGVTVGLGALLGLAIVLLGLRWRARARAHRRTDLRELSRRVIRSLNLTRSDS